MTPRPLLLAGVLVLCASASAQPVRPPASDVRPAGATAPVRVTFDRPDVGVDEALAALGVGADRWGGPSASLDPGVSLELDGATALAYTADGAQVVAVGLLTATLAVHDAATGAFVWGLALGGRPTTAAVAAGVAVVTASAPAEAVIVDLATRTVRARVPLGGEPVAVQFSPDGQVAYIVSAGSQRCARVDVATGTVLSTFPFYASIVGGTYYPDANRALLAVTPFRVAASGSRLVAGSVGAVRVIDAATGAVLSTEITPDRVEVLEVTPDGATAFAGGGRGEAFALFLDVATGAVDRPTLPVGATSIGSAALRADGQRALADVVAPGVTFGTSFVERTGEVTPVGLTGHVVPLGQDRALVAGVLGGAVYDLATGETVASVPPVDAPLAAGAGDGQRAVLAERLETLVRFDGAAFQRSPLGEGVEGDAPRTVAFSPDGQRAVVTLGYSDNLAVVDVAAGQIVARLPARTAGPADAVFTPDGARIIVTGQSAPGSPDGAVVVLDAVTGAELDREMPVTSRLRAVLVTPDGTRAVVHDAASGAVLVYALTGAGLEFEYAAPIGGETGSTTAYATQPSVRLSPTGRHVVGLDRAERRVYVLDLTTGGSSALNVNALYSDFGFSADGSRVLVTSIGRRVFLIALGPSPTPELLASRTFPDEVGPVAFDAVAGRFLVADPASTPASFFEVSSATGTVLRQTVVNEGFLIEQIRWTPETGTVLAGRSPDGEVGYVSSNGDRTALLAPPAEVDVTGRTVVAAIPGPDRIEIVALAPVASEPGPTAGPALAVGPNPSAGPVAVRLTWPETGPARVEVLDVLGRTVAVLHDGPLASGPHTFSWAAGVVPGTYVVRAEGASTVSGRVTVVR